MAASSKKLSILFWAEQQSNRANTLLYLLQFWTNYNAAFEMTLLQSIETLDPDTLGKVYLENYKFC